MRITLSAPATIGAASLLTACDQPAPAATSSKSPDYEISKNGIVKETDKRNYESLGDTTFQRSQVYKVRRVTKGGEKESRLLFLKAVLKVGGKDVSEGIATVVIDKGEGELACSNLYDVKIANYDTTPDPACTYTTLGDTPLNATNVVFK